MKQQDKITPPTTNTTIKCGVECCAHHAPTDYCSLSQIQVGACASEVTQCKNTECASFQMGYEGCTR